VSNRRRGRTGPAWHQMVPDLSNLAGRKMQSMDVGTLGEPIAMFRPACDVPHCGWRDESPDPTAARSLEAASNRLRSHHAQRHGGQLEDR
jgi:hypothetical protein